MHGLFLTMEDSALPNGGPPVPRGDSRIVTVAEKWSKCMAARGHYSYPTPLDSLFDVKWSEDYPPSDAQRKTARDDLTCKRQTNYVGVAVAVQEAYDRAYIDVYRDRLDVISYDVASSP